jgi:hypothetical protein
MSLREILTSIPAETAAELFGLLKQRESLSKQLAEIDSKIEELTKVKGASKKGGARRKPSVEIPDLLSKTPTGLTSKEIMSSLSLNYAQVYMTLTKLKKANKVVLNKETGKYSIKASGKSKNNPF